MKFFVWALVGCLGGCGFVFGPPVRTTTRPFRPGDDQSCMVEFSPHESPACNNP